MILKETQDKIETAKTKLLLAREDLNNNKLFHLAGELSAVTIVLDELQRYLITTEPEEIEVKEK